MRKCHTTHTYISFFVVTLIIFLLIAAQSFAQGTNEDAPSEVTGYSTNLSDNVSTAPKSKFKELFKNWNARVGVMAMHIPEYSGSKDMRFMVLPIIAVDYRRFLVLTYASASLYVPVPKTNYKLLLGLTLSYDYIGIGVTNFEEPEYGIVLAPTLMFNPNKNISAVFTAHKSLKGSDGLDLELKLRGKIDLLKNLEIGFEAFGKYSDTKRMQFKYGVSYDESRTEGYEPYYPGGSFSAAGAGISVRYKFNKNFSLNFIYQAEFLLNNAARSPTTETIYQPRTLMMLIHTF